MLDVTRPVEVATQPDMVRVSTERLRDSAIKRGHTISGVTAEAGVVFEHLLRRSQSDSSSHSHRVMRRPVSRRRLTAIAEASHNADTGHLADDSTDNWTADITRDSIDTRLSSADGLDEVDGKPGRSSVQWGGGFSEASRDSVDGFESKRLSGTRLSSNDTVDDPRLGSTTQSNGYFQQFSRDSGDILASSGVSDRHTAEAPSPGSMSMELADDLSDADDERRRKEKVPKKKKSVFQRVRERLRATFSRDEDRNRAAQKASKYMHANGKANGQNWLTASFRRRRKKQKTDHGSENVPASASNHLGSSVNSTLDSQGPYMVDRQSTYRDQPKSKGLLSGLQRRFNSVQMKRSQSRASGSSRDETNIDPVSESQQRILSRYVTADAVQESLPVASSSLHREQGHHSLRGTLELDVMQPVQPAPSRTTAESEAVLVDVEQSLSSDLEERVRDWDYIDGNEQQLGPLQHATTRRFSEKSPAEKEELYERIALQLGSIGDSYAVNTPLQGDESAECAASESVMDSTREVSVDLSAFASQMLSTANHSYSTFQSVVSEAIRGESGLQQIAFMFQLSRTAIEYAGTGTELAISIKDMTLRYFEQHFAPWIVEQGGWETVAESMDSDLD